MDTKERDITNVLELILDKTDTILENLVEKEGEDGILDFIAALYAATSKYSLELEISQKDAVNLFKQMWEANNQINLKELN